MSTPEKAHYKYEIGQSVAGTFPITRRDNNGSGVNWYFFDEGSIGAATETGLDVMAKCAK